MPPQPPRPGRPAHRPQPVRTRTPTPPPLHGRSQELNHGAPAGFRKMKPDLFKSYQSSLPTLYAVIGTWYESDVIEATVKNCFANGCTKVFLVDNDSPDDTKERALKVGAEIGRIYRTQFYDDDLRLRLMNDVMKEVTEHEKLPNLWWLALDADEFPCGPRGERLLDYLRDLDARVNCVGANAIDLYPTTEPYYSPGMHPADTMPEGLARKLVRGVCCESGHWKHPLLRYEGGVFNMAQSRGQHVPFVQPGTATPLESDETIVIFHAPIRAKEATFKRLEALCAKKEELGGQHRSAGDDHLINAQGAIKRWRSLEHVYAGRWDQVELPHAQIYGGAITGIALYPWRRLLPKLKSFPRWYPDPNATMTAGKVELPLVGQ